MLQVTDGLPKADTIYCSPTSPSPQGQQSKARRVRPYARQKNLSEVIRQQASKTRHRYVCYHWQRAKRLSLTFSDQTAEALFPDEAPQCPVERIRAYILLRRDFLQRNNHQGALKADALLWREICAIKGFTLDRNAFCNKDKKIFPKYECCSS